MDSVLTPDQIENFHRDGFVSPVPVFSPAEARALRKHLEAAEAEAGSEAAEVRTDLHLLTRWAWDVVRDPRIVAPVRDVLGENVLLWSLNWFIKEPRDGKFVSYHQDATYWGLEPHDVVTAWVALSDTGPETGPMRFVPGSHRGPLCDHRETWAGDNLLSRGQTIDPPVTTRERHGARARWLDRRDVDPPRAVDPRLRTQRHRRPAHRNGAALRLDPGAADSCGGHRRPRLRARRLSVISSLLPAPTVDFGAAERERHRDALDRLWRALMPDGQRPGAARLTLASPPTAPSSCCRSPRPPSFSPPVALPYCSVGSSRALAGRDRPRVPRTVLTGPRCFSSVAGPRDGDRPASDETIRIWLDPVRGTAHGAR